MRMDYEDLLAQQDGAVLTIIMNRPDVLNAVNEPLLDSLGALLEEAAQETSIRCIVLTGAGRAFGSGADLRGFSALHARGEPMKVSEFLQKYHRFIRSIRSMPKPV